MFDELRRRFGRKPEETEFKPFEESTGNPTTADISKVDTEQGGAPDATIAATKSDSVELRVMHPTEYGDVAQVADCLLDGCTVVLNLDALDRPTIIKMLDFLNGVTYCTDGEIKKVAPTTFIVTPHSNVDVTDV